MGLFGKGGKSAKRGGTTIVASGTTLRGELHLQGNLHIDGRVEGDIESESDVSIGGAGSFEGEIRARRMVVSGFARGRIECDSLEIVDKGQVFGEVSSRSFVIEPGGQFVGESRSTDEEAIAALSHMNKERPAAASPGAREDHDPGLGDVDVKVPGPDPEEPLVTSAQEGDDPEAATEPRLDELEPAELDTEPDEPARQVQRGRRWQ